MSPDSPETQKSHPEDTLLESRKTRDAMAWIAFRKSLDEYLEQELTSVVDLSQAPTLNEFPDFGAFGSVESVLNEARPSLQMLTMLKSATKQSSKESPEGDVNPPMVVYLATICTARLRLGAKITEFDDKALVERIDRLLDLGELPATLSDIFVDLRFKLTLGDESSG